MAIRTWFGVGQYILLLPDCQSLKDKRQRLRSLQQRLADQLGVAVAEVALQDKWQRAAVSIACVSGTEAGVDRILDRVVAIIERDDGVVVTDRAVIVDQVNSEDDGLPPGWDLLHT